MIGRGAPDRRDDVGYNKPDWTKMCWIGMLNTTYSPVEAYIVLQTLQKYTKRQLADKADDLKATFAAYEKHLSEVFSPDQLADELEDAKEGRKHKREDYEPMFLRHYGMSSFNSEPTFLLAFGEFIPSFDVHAYNGGWRKVTVPTADGRGTKEVSAMSIPVSKIDEFLKDAKEIGKAGYIPDDKLSAIINAEREAWQRQEDKKAIEIQAKLTAPRKLIDLEKENAYHLNLFAIPKISDSEDKKLADKLWDMKGICLSYVDRVSDNDNIIISVKKAHIPDFVDFARSIGLDTASSDEKIKALREKERAAQEEKERREQAVKSRQLVDVDKLDLPFVPYPFQVEDAKTLISENKMLMGHDMGCGKTFIASLVGQSLDMPKLVVCPESLRLNWQRELEQFHKGADIRIIYSDDKEYKNSKTLTFAKDWTIMGYSSATKFKDLILLEHFDCVFIDEAHNCKAVNNYGKPASQRAEALMSIGMQADNLYLMTGTPMPTRNKDLYNLLVMLGQVDSTKKGAWFEFGKKYCWAHQTLYGWDFNGASNTSELHDVLNEKMVRRLKKEVLPNLTKQRQFIPSNRSQISDTVSKRAFKDYKEVEKRLFDLQDDETYMGLAMTGRRVLSTAKIEPALNLAEAIVGDLPKPPKFSLPEIPDEVIQVMNDVSVTQEDLEYLGNENEEALFNALKREGILDAGVETVKAMFASVNAKIPDNEQLYSISFDNLINKYKPQYESPEIENKDALPIVIVTQFNETMDAFKRRFGDNASYIRGGMSDRRKQKAIDDFQSGKTNICVINTIAAGVGITLTRSHNMIICDYDWTPANMTQVEDRICRSGQTEPCNIYYVYFEDALIDKVFVDMITTKSANIDRTVDGIENTVDLVSARSSGSYLDNLKAELKAAEKAASKPAERKRRTKAVSEAKDEK
jgi:SNF2 family DNA or RNA helicase